MTGWLDRMALFSWPFLKAGHKVSNAQCSMGVSIIIHLAHTSYVPFSSVIFLLRKICQLLKCKALHQNNSIILNNSGSLILLTTKIFTLLWGWMELLSGCDVLMWRLHLQNNTRSSLTLNDVSTENSKFFMPGNKWKLRCEIRIGISASTHIFFLLFVFICFLFPCNMCLAEGPSRGQKLPPPLSSAASNDSRNVQIGA